MVLLTARFFAPLKMTLWAYRKLLVVIGVILSVAKDLKVSTSITQIANCEILRSAQNDPVGN